MRWQHIKDSWRKSRKPFESATGKFTLFISLIAGLVLIRCITESWGNYMTWLALGIPGIVFLIYFVWNLANFHHKIYRDRTPALITILLFSTVSLALLLVVQVTKNVQLKKQSNPSKETSTAKPFPDEINPRPEQPPAPPTQQFAFVANPSILVTNAQPAIFKAYTTTNGNAGAKIDERMADLQALVDQGAAQKAAKIELEKQQKLLEIPRDWGRGLEHYRRLLVVLQDDLSKKAKSTGDGIFPSPGYSQCMPSNIDPETGEIKAATIGLQINTNVTFQIIISQQNWIGHRQVCVSCAAGFLKLYPGTNDDFYAVLNAYNTGLSFPDHTTIDKADDLVSDNLTTLIAAQFRLVGQTNQK